MCSAEGPGSLVAVGEPAPDFKLPTHDGRRVGSADYRGRQALVLYFYPKAHTSGCTQEGLAFTELYEQFTEAGAEVFGVSADSPAVNADFAHKNGIAVGGLLTDEHWELLHRFGLREYRGNVIKRITYVVDKLGILRLAYFYPDRGDAADHAAEALKAVKALADS